MYAVRKITKQTVSAGVIGVVATMAMAEDKRSVDAHEHGAGSLDVIVEGNTLFLGLRAPGADIVGFEYEASTAEDRALFNNAMALLSDAANLFKLPDDAGCTLTSVDTEVESGEDEHDDHADEDTHDDHADEDAEHSEFHVSYQFDCTAPDQINHIEMIYFEKFPNAVELDVKVATPAGTGATEVERDDPMLVLEGMF